MRYDLLLSRSITHAQRMSAVLKRAGISARYSRPPMELSDQGCGYAVYVEAGKASRAMTALREAGLLPTRVFQLRDGAYHEVSA